MVPSSATHRPGGGPAPFQRCSGFSSPETAGRFAISIRTSAWQGSSLGMRSAFPNTLQVVESPWLESARVPGEGVGIARCSRSCRDGQICEVLSGSGEPGQVANAVNRCGNRRTSRGRFRKTAMVSVRPCRLHRSGRWFQSIPRTPLTKSCLQLVHVLARLMWQ